jgi:aminocarboxymuconate-semialdehyde decarboxylase
MIDVHTHIVPDRIPFGCSGDDRWPTLVRRGREADVLIQGQVFRTLRDVCWDPGPRLDEMAAHGIEAQLVSPMPELFSYWAHPALAERFCESVNHWTAEFVRAHPAQFSGLGIVPLQNPGRAAGMLAGIAGQGLAGIEIGSNVNGIYLSAPCYLEVFAEAARLGLIVFVHAFHPPAQRQLPPGPISYSVALPAEITMGLSALIGGRVLAQVPGLRVLASHGGGGAVTALARLEHAWRVDSRVRELLPEQPYTYLRQVFFDTIVFDPRALDYLISVVGAEQVMTGSDYPFLRLDAGKIVDELPSLSERTRQAIKRVNALGFIGPGAAAPGSHARPGSAQLSRRASHG